ncbi:unnamed protein product [Rotaria sordida]|uniref:Uncharacterized protein n=1 Tax=Rotaria sordida TaxID=392033 RepID=A0A813YMM6_9BILA|nr:unnamed protein product [Rotaria sordida]
MQNLKSVNIIISQLWEFYNERRCIRTYAGHSQAVRDVNFNNTGTEFLSASHDKMIKLWDTETGQVLLILLHFVDRNRRIVSTSDDKNIRVWEWNIPVDFKYIADPTMHSMPAVAQSRNGKYLAFQSMDNQIRTMEPLTNFRWKSKKIFKGHMVSGYACGLDFSPDMSYLISGDADGCLIIWDCKTTRIFERIKAHDDVCIDAKWHWHEKSRILTAGWDNVVKLWD